MPWFMRTEGSTVLVVRQRDKKVVGRHKDRKRALAQLRVLSSLEKASFGGDRSEAGRYAANMRWKNQTPKQKLDALGSKELKIVEIRGDETFKKKDGSVTRRATLIVLDDDGKEILVDVTSKGVKGSQFIQVEAKRGNKQIGYLWAQTDYDGQYGQKGKVAIGQVDVISSERRKGVATALMRLGKRYNIGSEPIYHSTVLTTAGAAFARDTEMEKASFGGDRSEAGRYAANMRWQGNVKDESSGGSSSALAEVLQPTFDAEVAKATGRPWASMMTENFPPELISSYEKYRSEWLAHYKKLYEFDIKMRVEKMPVWDEEADEFWKKTSLEERKLRSGQVEKSLNKSISAYAEKLVGKGILSEKIAAAIKERLVFQVNQDNEFSEWSSKDPEDSKNFDPKEMLMDENLRVVVCAPNYVVAKILSDGRIKSQHETYTSGGALDPSLRSRAEGRMFSQHPDTVKEMRPIYGSVLVNGVDGQSFSPGREYGDVGIVLKKDIKSRTTFTSRDSLAVGTQPSPISQPNKSSYFPDSFGGGYIEAQIHGQVKVSDIAYIVGNFSNKDLLGEVEKAAKSLGIPIYDTKDPYNTDFKVEETGDMAKARGRLVAVRGSEQKLFHTHDEVSKPFGMTMRMGYIENADGRRFDVNVDSALARGYWTDPDATVNKSLVDLLKASFGGDRSEAGRYAANMRWKGNVKGDEGDELKTLLGEYPVVNDEARETFIDAPISRSGLGKTMREINKEISQRESNGDREDEMLPAVILSAYLGKGDDDFFVDLNRHLRRGNPLEDFLREQLTEEEERREKSIERSISALEQDEDDGNDNSAEIESLRQELEEIEGRVYDAERFDADEWNYDEHGQGIYDSQYGSFTISINREDVKMPKVVAYGLMDDAFIEFGMVAPSNFRAYRGIDPATIASLEASVGKTVEDLGFCSTSKSIDTAIKFSGLSEPFQSEMNRGDYKEGDTLPPEKRIATILIPKGQKILVPDPSGERMGEGEVILNRGTRFNVVGVNELGPILEVVTDETK